MLQSVKKITSLFYLLMIMPFVWTGCVTGSALKKLGPEEISCREKVMWGEISKSFESNLKVKKNNEVIVYLEKLANKLGQNTSGLRGEKIHVSLVQDYKGKWESFSLPGHYLYLPIELIRKLEFENEVAALIAIQLGHLANKDILFNLKTTVQPFESEGLDEDLLSDSISTGEKVAIEEKIKTKKSEINSITDILEIRNVEQLSELGYFKPNGIIKFSTYEEIGAVQSAVGVLYRAGFDARGLVSLYHYLDKNINHSPYDTAMIEQLVDSARSEIALYAPVRNPVVRSQSFLLMQKKFQKL